MRIVTYELTDHDGNTLKIEPSMIPGACWIKASDPSTEERIFLVVPADEVPEVAARIARAMYDAAGRPAPIILEHPGPLTSSLGEELGDGIRVSHGDGAVLLAVRGVAEAASPETARQVAAHLAARADEVDAEPDRKLVAAIADLICTHGGVGRGTGTVSARAILARYRLEERAA